MIIYLNKHFDDECVEEFINKVNSSENYQDITVYLSSYGGKVTVTPILRDIIQKYQMNLIACSEIYSSALDLFLTSNTPRSVLDETVGLFHKTHMNINVHTNLKHTETNNSLLKIWKTEPECDKLVRQFLDLTPKQLKRFNKGEDIYLNHKELRKALKNSEKYFGR
jgi:hypothetical protein